MAAALAMKEVAFCSNVMWELGFDESFGSVSLYIDNTSMLHVAGSRTYSPRAKHIALRYSRTYSPRAKHIALSYYFSVQELLEEGKISVHCVKNEDQLAYLDSKYLVSKYCHRSNQSVIHFFIV